MEKGSSTMRGKGFQGVLFERPEGLPAHFFYVVTDDSSYKAGYSKNVARRMKHAQLRHTTLVGTIPCNCGLSREGAYLKCVLEIRWEQTHSRARLPQGEWYKPTSGVQAGLRFMFGRDDRAMGIIDQVERHHSQAA